MQAEERLKGGKIESAHVKTTSMVNYRKKTKDNKETAVGKSQPKKQNTRDKVITCFFCKKFSSREEGMSQVHRMAGKER